MQLPCASPRRCSPAPAPSPRRSGAGWGATAALRCLALLASSAPAAPAAASIAGSAVGCLPSARQGAVAVEWCGGVLLVGGSWDVSCATLANLTYFPDVFLLRPPAARGSGSGSAACPPLPAGARWESWASLGAANRRTHHAAAAVGNTLFVLGGFGGPRVSKAPGGGVALDSVVAVDLSARGGAVTGRRSLPMGNATNLAAAAVPWGSSAGGVVVAGGYVYGAVHSISPGVWLYSVANDTWRALAPMAAARAGFSLTPLPGAPARGRAAAAAAGRYLLAVGGFAKDPVTGFRPLAATEVYDIAVGHWVAGPPLPAARAQVQAVVVGASVFAVGGTNATADICYKSLSILQRPVLALALGNLTAALAGAAGAALALPWRQASALPTPRGYLAAAAAGGTLYTLGGYNGTHDTDLVEAFDVAAGTWLSCAAVPAPAPAR